MVRRAMANEKVSRAFPRPGRAVRPSDLKRLNLTGDTHDLYCPRCGGRFSANQADYWWATKDVPFKCCKVNSHLIKKR